MKPLPVLAACLAFACCTRPPDACLLPRQTPMLMIDMFFGRSIEGHAPVTDAAWSGFAKTEITPRFPDGFTALDASGQWLNPQTGRIGAEASKLVRIVAQRNAGTAESVAAIAASYRTQFHQTAVGISTSPVCAAF